MKYTEEDLRKAFRAGNHYGQLVAHNPSTNADDENDYINSLSQKVVEEDKISFTYSFLRRKIDWEEFCDLTGIDYYAKRNGYEIKDSEIFYIPESRAKQYDLI
jgi:hypothetical protein